MIIKKRKLYNLDSKTGFHTKHINKVTTDWIKIFNEEQKNIVKDIIGDWLIEFKYEEDKNW